MTPFVAAIQIHLLVGVVFVIHQMPLTDAWMNAPYGNDKFNYRGEYGKNLSIVCDAENIVQSFNVQYWIRPDLVVMKGGSYSETWTPEGMATWQVSDNGSLMTVTNLNQDQFGFYYCIVSSNGELLVVKKAINYKGPYFGSLWLKYRKNVIVGLSAAGVFLVCMISSCIIGDCLTRNRISKTDSDPAGYVEERVPARTTSGENFGLKRRGVVSTPGVDFIEVHL